MDQPKKYHRFLKSINLLQFQFAFIVFFLSGFGSGQIEN